MPAYEARMQTGAQMWQGQSRAAGPRPARPLTAHHMFAPFVALWFGALFSLSSLAVRTGLFEQMIVSIGVDRVFPYASPPLGHTARLLIAAVFGLVGAGLGSMLAKVVAGGAAPGERPGDSFYPASGEQAEQYRVRARDAHPDAPARRPISASDELGGAELAPAGFAEDLSAHDFPARRVPAPWVPRAPLEPGQDAEPETPPLPEWFGTTAAEVPAVLPMPAVEAQQAIHALTEKPQANDPAPTDPVPAEPVLADTVIAGDAGEVTDPDYPEAWRNTAERIAHAPPASLGHVELIERLAIALNKRTDDPGAGASDASHVVEVIKPATGPDAAATIQALREALSTLRGG